MVRVLIQKPIIAHLVKEFPAFYGLEGSLPCSQEPATGPYHEPSESSPPHPNTLSLKDHVCLSAHLRRDLPSLLYPSSFPITFYTHFSPPSCMLYI
jgi:hypothetical protein